jgi:hypothetical protein
MKSILRNIRAAILLAGVLITFSTPVRAQSSISLANLLAGGSITSGNLVFSDFNNFSQIGDLTVNPASIIISSTTAGIQFQSSYWTLSGMNQSYYMSLSFDVTSISGQVIIGNALSITGGHHGEGYASSADTISATDKKSLASELVYLNNPATGKDNFNDSAVFAAQSVITVNQDLAMTTGPDNSENVVFAGRFNQSFTTTLTPVPEPAMMALVGMGGFGLFIFRRRK